MMYRLPKVAGEWIDRDQSIDFTFEGARYSGFAGDTISSALAASGVMVLGRSFKYHRARGIHSYANHDINALFQVDDTPNVRGDVTELRYGMNVTAVNTVGGLASDRGRWLDRFSKLLPVGFYYKTFYSKRAFPHFEKRVRAMSGLGKLAMHGAHAKTPKRYAFCDVLVIGAGRAGIAAAFSAAEAGAKVLLVEEASSLPGASELQELAAKLLAHPNVETLSSSFAAGAYADRWVAVIEPHRMTKVRAKSIVLATGAIELPAVFRNNDLPGVLQTSAALRLLERHGIAPGHDIVVQATSRAGYEAAVKLAAHGLNITHLIDPREGTQDADLAELVNERQIELIAGARVIEAHAGANECVRAVTIGADPQHPLQTIECDCVLVNGGWATATQLLLQAGGTVKFDAHMQMHLPHTLPSGYFVAGAVNGVFAAHAAFDEGMAVGRAAAEFAQHPMPHGSPVAIKRAEHTNAAVLKIDAHPRGKDFVDFDEDIQVKDLHHAAQEGFDSIELLKRYTTVGMGPSQGKHSNPLAARLLAQIRDESLDSVGLTTARPMYHPVPLKHLAGRAFNPQRATPIEKRHDELGAKWMLAGQWHRPEYYARSNESREQSIAAEVASVRRAVGLIDVGTLGKIEIYGPEAGAFLDRAYAGRYGDMKVGMTRYGLLLDESGTIIDDGVVARLHERAFYFTTTTGNSATVYRELLRLNAQWGMQCSLVNVTGHRAAFNLAGPCSRALLQDLTKIDLADHAFPYLGIREGSVAGISARLMRVGFVGELGYEIHVPYSQAFVLWDALLNAGARFSIRPFGVEAQRVLRLEKGHFIVGQDTDGLTNPFEARAEWAVRMNKPFFVGQRSLRMLQKRGPRQLLVGFAIETKIADLKECHLVIAGNDIAGRITSATYSPTLNKTIGLAMVTPKLAELGTSLSIRLSDGKMIEARVVPIPFYDANSDRQRVKEAA